MDNLKIRKGEQNHKLTNWEEIPCDNVRRYQYGTFPELIYVIKTGFDNLYIVVQEDAYQYNTGESKLMTKQKLEKTYNIKVL